MLPTPPSSASRSLRPLERQRPMNGRLSPPRGSRRGLGWSCEIAEVGADCNIVDHTTVDRSTVGHSTVFEIVYVEIFAATAAVGVAAVAAEI